jgi:predicted kinase
MKKTIVITIGAAGAGKTTYAERLTKKLNGIFGLRVADCCADDYFVKDGKYNFDRNKLGQAHGYCKDQARKYMRSGVDCLVVHNTNTTHKERKPYHEMATEWDYRVVERRIGGTDEASIKLYAQRNLHSVPEENIRAMANRIKNGTK